MELIVATARPIAGAQLVGWGTAASSQFFNKYKAKFSGKTPVVVDGSPDAATFYTVAAECSLRWSQLNETSVDLRKEAALFLIDCEPEQALEVRWAIRAEGMTVPLLPPTASSIPELPNRRAIINNVFKNIINERSFQILFESRFGTNKHAEALSFFEAAEIAAGARRRWDQCDVSKHLDELIRFDENSDLSDPIDAVVVAAARTDQDASPTELIILGLIKTQPASFDRGDQIGSFVVRSPFSISYNAKRRRWIVQAEAAEAQELGISSQPVELPIAHPSLHVVVSFARHSLQ